MAKKHVMDAEQYAAMVETMKELAFRGEKEEAIIMRVANAGGVDEVATHIKRMRLYAKKQGMVRQSGQPVDDTEDAAPKGKGKKKARRKRASEQAHDMGSGADAL